MAWRRLVVVAVAFTLMASGAWAQTLRQSVDRAATVAAHQEMLKGGMRPAYKWTGIALLGIAGANAALALALSGDDTRVCAIWQGNDCEDSTQLWVSIGAIAGAGVAVLVIGSAKASAEITPTRGGILLRQRIRF